MLKTKDGSLNVRKAVLKFKFWVSLTLAAANRAAAAAPAAAARIPGPSAAAGAAAAAAATTAAAEAITAHIHCLLYWGPSIL